MPVLLPLTLLAAAIGVALLAGRWLPSLGQPLTRNAVAHDLLANGQPQLAATLFEDPIFKGVALYRAGQYQRAAREFFEADDIEALYNMASALAHYGRYEEAIKALQSVISREPTHEDALHNIDVVRAAARLARQQRDPTQMGLPANPSDKDGDEPLQSLAALATNQDIQTISDEPGEGGSESARSDGDESGSGQMLPGSTKYASNYPSKASAVRPTGVFAAGATRGLNEKLDDYTLSGGHNASGQNAPDPEQAMAGEISLRHITDDPAVVLRARLQAAWTRRQGKPQ